MAVTEDRATPEREGRTFSDPLDVAYGPTDVIHAGTMYGLNSYGQAKADPQFYGARGARAVAVARASVADAKGSINLRIESTTRQLIDDAAAVLGKTRTEFMVESARRQAVDVLLDQRLFTLDSERYNAFMQALDNPPAPGPKLKALLRRTPAWQK